VGQARALGISPDRFIYLHGAADVRERLPMERADLSASPAATRAAQLALQRAGVGVNEVDLFDLYSCFPIAVFNLRDSLGISPEDTRPLTVTGGLPYFGGAGNNYSMHAIAAMVRALRDRPDARGLVSANGGFLSKTSVGVYSAMPAQPLSFDDAPLQAEVDAWPAPPLTAGAGTGVVGTYTIDYAGPAPVGVVIGRRPENGARFVAMTDPAGAALAQAMIAAEPLGATVRVAPSPEGRDLIQTFEPVA
jgi:acetyl-CoA C-acetyltransferase